jgi:hypothetical protein
VSEHHFEACAGLAVACCQERHEELNEYAALYHED